MMSSSSELTIVTRLDRGSLGPACIIVCFCLIGLAVVSLTAFACPLLFDSRYELRLTQIGWVPDGSLILIFGGWIGSLSNGSRETTTAGVSV